MEKSNIVKKMLLRELLTEKRADETLSNQEMLEMVKKIVPVERKTVKMVGEKLWKRLNSLSATKLRPGDILTSWKKE